MVKALYFKTYYAYLLGQLDTAKSFYELLKEEFSACKKRDVLSETQYKQLKVVREAIKTGKIAENRSWMSDLCDAGVTGDGSSDMEQTILVKRLHTEALKDIQTSLSPTMYLYNIEHPCTPYGKVDMYYKDASTAYPTEVKRGCGKHDLIGQIMKYTLSFKLKLHLNLYELVQPVTICGSYEGFTLRELKSLGVCTLQHTVVDNRLAVRTV